MHTSLSEKTVQDPSRPESAATGSSTIPVWRLAAFILFTAMLAVVAGFRLGQNYTLPDSGWYVLIAQGRTAEVLQPFSSRQLGPLLIALAARLFHIDLLRGFLIESTLALFGACTLVALQLRRMKAPGWVYPLIATAGFWTVNYQSLCLPDLWFLFLLTIFLTLLYEERLMLASLMIFPLWFSRESTLIVLLALLVTGYKRLKIQHLGVAILAALAAIVWVKHLTAVTPGNQEHLNYVLYLAGKVPWNFARNLLGIMPWSNVYPTLCTAPSWQMPLHISRIAAVGICGWHPEYPLAVLRTALALFGILPTVLIHGWRHRDRAVKMSLYLRFCLVYGSLSFVAAPLLGASYLRLYTYSWPVFILAAPCLLAGLKVTSRGLTLLLWILHVALSWSTLLLGDLSLAAGAVAFLTVLAAHAAVWAILQHSSAPVNLQAEGAALR